MSIDPIWLPHIAGVVGEGAITVVWPMMKRGLARDMERERLACIPWDASRPAE